MAEYQGIDQPVHFHVSLSLLVCRVLSTLSAYMKRWGGRKRPAMRTCKAETKTQGKNKTLKPRNRVYCKRLRILSQGNTHRLQEPGREFSSWKPIFIYLHHLFSFLLFLTRCFLLRSISPWSVWDKIKILPLTLIDFFRRKQRWRDLWFRGKQVKKITFPPRPMINEQIYNKYVRSAAC